MIILQPYLYEIIRKYVNIRIQNCKYPYVVSEHEIFKQIRDDVHETLDEMEADGLIQFYRNLNGLKMFRPTEKDETNNVQ